MNHPVSPSSPLKLLFRALLLAGGLAGAFFLQRTLVQTLAPLPLRTGYSEGDFLHLAPTTGGMVTTLMVERGTPVTAGALLFALDATAEKAALREAEGRLAQAEATLADLRSGKRAEELAVLRAQQEQAQAQLTLSQAQKQRVERLAVTQVVAPEQVDQARSAVARDEALLAEREAAYAVGLLAARPQALAAAQAVVLTARAQQEKAAWNLAERQVFAPVAGTVTEIFYRPGETVTAGRPVVELLPPENRHVRLFVPEAALGEIRLGQRATLGCSGCPRGLAGQVRFIASRAEFTPPVLYSREARGHLVFRIDIRPDPAAVAFLHPGQPVDVSLEAP